MYCPKRNWMQTQTRKCCFHGWGWRKSLNHAHCGKLVNVTRTSGRLCSKINTFQINAILRSRYANNKCKSCDLKQFFGQRKLWPIARTVKGFKFLCCYTSRPSTVNTISYYSSRRYVTSAKARGDERHRPIVTLQNECRNRLLTKRKWKSLANTLAQIDVTITWSNISSLSVISSYHMIKYLVIICHFQPLHDQICDHYQISRLVIMSKIQKLTICTTRDQRNVKLFELT